MKQASFFSSDNYVRGSFFFGEQIFSPSLYQKNLGFLKMCHYPIRFKMNILWPFLCRMYVWGFTLPF